MTGREATTGWRRATRKGKPSVFTIPPHVPVVDALARGIRDDLGDDPLALARATVLLPTRRATRSLREAFLRLSGGAPLLLPRMLALNDVDEEDALLSGFAVAADGAPVPPAIAPLRRQLMLARLIMAADRAMSPDRAAWLAAELAQFLDQVQTEKLSFDNLDTLVPEKLAEHWQVTVKFLRILSQAWPSVLAEENCIDPAAHRNLVFAAQAKIWTALGEARQLDGPVIAAGSTGSIPATADLLDAIARLPLGCVVLPGLDAKLDDDAWATVDESHPQYGMKHLLARFGIDRENVMIWPISMDDTPAPHRELLASELMRPAVTTERWREAKLPSESFAGLSWIDAATPREEATAIALVMRETLEQPGATCALVTPDRDLAQRVAAELARWDIVIDDSGGRPLEQTPPGTFLKLVAEVVAEDFAPVPLLAACKHPLAAGGNDPARFRHLTRMAEIFLIRGPRPAPGLVGLHVLFEAARKKLKPDIAADISEWLSILDRTFAPFAAVMTAQLASVSDLIAAHMRCAESFAATPGLPGPSRVWADDAGEAAAGFAAEWATCADVMPDVSPSVYPALFAALISARVVRPRYGGHPRLAILGPLEARLQHFDTVVLGSLNEGTWPAKAALDPWMSRPMRRNFGLASPERRIGLAAHDIAQALCMARVVLTRATKVEGTPTVPSRWLMRLEQIAATSGLASPRMTQSVPWTSWAGDLTRPAAFAAWPAPAPCPPVAARPRAMSVTRIEEWMRDPYATYARSLLDLTALDALDADMSAADYGTAIHAALATFVNTGIDPRDANALERLMALGHDEFESLAVRPGVKAFWWPRFARIAAWFIETERARRGSLTKSFAERTGKMTLAGPAGPFELRATADRIDVMADGSLAIIDYKTGTVPKELEIAAGFAPQLPLEAAIALAGGFPDVGKRNVGALAHWRLHGRGKGGEAMPAGEDVGALAKGALDGLTKLIATYDQESTPYPARPHPTYAPKYSDYLHLARVREWASLGDGDGE
ncbi:MAG: double-strand break repair protein AddB [Rhodobacteraceae bacterium]|nr:double-strand break repair protein AddB [Paracoccaceae bacterium]